MGGIKSERRAASDRNRWAAYVRIRNRMSSGKVKFPMPVGAFAVIKLRIRTAVHAKGGMR
jgi:hypothetical protein